MKEIKKGKNNNEEKNQNGLRVGYDKYPFEACTTSVILWGNIAIEKVCFPNDELTVVKWDWLNYR